jgi:chromate transport protein ChrA
MVAVLQASGHGKGLGKVVCSNHGQQRHEHLELRERVGLDRLADEQTRRLLERDAQRIEKRRWALADEPPARLALPLALLHQQLGGPVEADSQCKRGRELKAFLRADLVDRWHWLTEAQLLDAIAVGQVTPGPVFTTATFIGYVLDGPAGAVVVATLGIFLPAFFFVAVSGPIVPRVRRSPTAGAFLDGVNVASLALMAVVTWQLGRAAVVDWESAALAAASALLLIRFRVSSIWIMLGGALVGAVVTWVR